MPPHKWLSEIIVSSSIFIFKRKIASIIWFCLISLKKFQKLSFVCRIKNMYCNQFCVIKNLTFVANKNEPYYLFLYDLKGPQISEKKHALEQHETVFKSILQST